MHYIHTFGTSLQISGVMTYGTNKLMVGSNVVNAGLKSSEYYIDTYLPATDGTSCILRPVLLM